MVAMAPAPGSTACRGGESCVVDKSVTRRVGAAAGEGGDDGRNERQGDGDDEDGENINDVDTAFVAVVDDDDDDNEVFMMLLQMLIQ